MIRSLELNFLQRIDKALPFPELVFGEIEAGGCYYTPEPCEEIICGIFVPRNAGIIVCSTAYGDKDTAETLAHEWRHHWQFYNGIRLDSVKWHGSEDYDAELRHYFKASNSERDALRFQARVAGMCEHWREVLEGIL